MPSKRELAAKIRAQRAKRKRAVMLDLDRFERIADKLAAALEGAGIDESAAPAPEPAPSWQEIQVKREAERAARPPPPRHQPEVVDIDAWEQRAAQIADRAWFLGSVGVAQRVYEAMPAALRNGPGGISQRLQAEQRAVDRINAALHW